MKTETVTDFGYLYIGNKMTGKKYFNAAWFDQTAQSVRALPGVKGVFNPIEHDRKMGLIPEECPNGSQEESEKFGLGMRKLLTADLNWISENSSGLIVGPDWEESRGTLTEIAFHQALGLPVWDSSVFLYLFRQGDQAGLLSNPNAVLPSLSDMLVGSYVQRP